MIYKHKSTKLNNFKYCYVSLTIQFYISHLFTHSYMIKQLYFYQFNLICHLIEHILNISVFDPEIGYSQVLPLWARVDQGRKAMKGYSAFPKAPALLDI